MYIIYLGWGNSTVNAYVVFLCYINPPLTLGMETSLMMSPGMAGMGMQGFTPDIWIWHCLIMLGLSSVLLGISVCRVRRAVLRCALGDIKKKKRPRRKKTKNNITTNAQSAAMAAGGTDIVCGDIHYDNNIPLQSVKGPPALWKELRTSFFYIGRKKSVIKALLLAAIVIGTYMLVAADNSLDDQVIHIVYVMIFTGVAMLCSLVFSATGITSEKEAKTWHLLLTSTLSDNEIIIGKAIGSAIRCLWLWLLLFAHIVLFIIIGYIHPVAFFHALLMVMGIMVFIIGSGLYCSARFKRTTSAVVVNILIACTLWVFIPILLAFISEISGYQSTANHFTEHVISGNPFVEAAVFTAATAGRRRAYNSLYELRYDWPSRGWRNIGSTSGIFFIWMILYMVLGAFLAWRARCLIRKRIF